MTKAKERKRDTLKVRQDPEEIFKRVYDNFIASVIKLSWYSLPSLLQLFFGIQGLFFLIYMNFIKLMIYPFLRFFLAKQHPLIIRTNGERFNGLEKFGYKFQPNYFVLSSHGGEDCKLRMHYIDEGPEDADKTVLLLHGDLTWSFMFRHVIPLLTSAKIRVIAPDLVGHGKSDKFSCIDSYSFENHVRNVCDLLHFLNVTNVTLVGHQIGGAVGLVAASRMPDRFSKLCVAETGLSKGQIFSDNYGALENNRRRPSIFARVQTALPQLIWRQFMAFIGGYIPVGYLLSQLEGIDMDDVYGYEAPYPDYDFNAALVRTAQLYPYFEDEEFVPYARKARNYLHHFEGQVLIVITPKDKVLLDHGPLFYNLNHKAKTFKIKNRGMVFEENYESVGKMIAEFVNGNVQ